MSKISNGVELSNAREFPNLINWYNKLRDEYTITRYNEYRPKIAKYAWDNMRDLLFRALLTSQKIKDHA